MPVYRHIYSKTGYGKQNIPLKKKLRTPIYRKFNDIVSADLVTKYLCINLLYKTEKKHVTLEPKKDTLCTFMHL